MNKLTAIFIISLMFAVVVYGFSGSAFPSIFENSVKVNTTNVQEIVNTINNYTYSLNSVKLNVKPEENVSSKIPCNLIWRYDFKCALKFALSEKNLKDVKPLADKLKGKSVQQDVWNILRWEGAHIKYNWSKARLLPTVIEWNGEEVRIIKKGSWYQTPEETIAKGNGICGDYAILTSALLLDMNITPYVIVIHFEGSQMSHAAVAVKIKGWYFVLDQHIPPMDLGAYYREWAYYRKNFGLRKIESVHFYKLEKIDGSVNVIDCGLIEGKDMMKQDYNITSNDAKALSYALMNLMEKKYKITPDPALKDLKPKSYLPAGYTSGRYWTFTFPHYADYYNPIFFKQYVNYFFNQLSHDAVSQDIEGSNRIWINVGYNDTNMVLHVIVATYAYK